MNEARRNALRVISNVLEALVAELNNLADQEKAAFERRPPGSQASFSGDESKEAHNVLKDAADAISIRASELDELTRKSS